MQQIINGSELTDLHVNAFQNLLKKNFPQIGGLQNDLYKEKTPLELKDS